MKHLTRRTVAVLGASTALAVALAGCTSSPSADEQDGPAKITLASQPNGAGLPFFIAEEEGFFEDEGLDVTIENYASGPASLAAGAANEWQAGWLGAPPALTGANTFGLIPAGLMMREDPNHIMFMTADVLKGSDPAEVLRTHPVATSQNSLAEQVMRGCAEWLGVPAEDVQMVPLDGGAVVQAIISGQVDVVNSWVTPAWPLLEDPETYVPVCDAEEAGVAVTSAIVVTPTFLKERPQDAEAFVRATTRATAFITENHEKAVAYMLDYYETYAITGSEEQAEWEVTARTWFDIDEAIGGVESGETSDALKASAEFFVNAGVYPEAPPIDDLLEEGLALLKAAQSGAAE
ncbi:ABC transporter substrate-binding protein [Microbacterium sp. A93]|uniref:ABC transporter substrate-binding protein n=1 Tax=unclassified Microbacterium TaxID=2609290 RepID=UPI003F41FEB2